MKHIDNLFKEKLYNHETSVPEGMWEKIAPIAEEESGRALLWFWFAGALALVLGGYGIYKMLNTNTPADPSTLAYEDQAKDQTSNFLAENNLRTIENENETATNEDDQELSEKSTDVNIIQNEEIEKPKLVASKKINTQPEKAVINKQSSQNNTKQIVNNTVENIRNIAGVPANLVITKSYINKEGSVIKQSNLTVATGSEDPVYDVIVNSEVKALNAGALLRIVEPFDIIPLPSLQKTLKKKTLTTHF